MSGIEADVKSGFEKQRTFGLEIMEKIGGKATWAAILSLIPLMLVLISIVLTFHYSDVKQIRNEIKRSQIAQASEASEYPNGYSGTSYDVD